MPAARPTPAFHLVGLDTRYALYVEPPAPDAESAPWPVVLCLDGDDQFTFLTAARRELVASGHSIPPLLLVGIGYGASYQQPGNHRARDYTTVPIEGASDGGGADAFLDFLKTTLWPELAARYPIHPDIRGIAGHSLGALFALHALFKPAPFFNRVLASAPSLWWGDRVLLRQIDALRAAQTRLPARVYLSVGLRDSLSMVTDLDLLESRLDEQPFDELVIHRERFPKKNHFNSIDPGFLGGLKALFARQIA
ncbi:MAG TPA: alpha/beta hydrolase-fold protein [Rariglobus sp.]